MVVSLTEVVTTIYSVCVCVPGLIIEQSKIGTESCARPLVYSEHPELFTS